MIDLSSWILGLVETIVKECILSSDFADSIESTGSAGDDLFGSGVSNLSYKFSRDIHCVAITMLDSPIKDTNLRSLDYPVFMHLVHIQALRNLRIALGHVNRFCKYLTGLTPRTENSHLSKEVLLDLVDYSGIDIPGLDKIFQELEDFVQEFDGMTTGLKPPFG